MIQAGDQLRGPVQRRQLVQTRLDPFLHAYRIAASEPDVEAALLALRQQQIIASETGIAELEVQRGDNRVRIRRASFAAPQEFVVAPHAYTAAPPLQAGVAPAPSEPVEKNSKPGPDPNLVLVKSPIVGTFYECPSPGAPPFVRIGERVQPGKVLYEINGVPEQLAREAFLLASAKLPLRCTFVTRQVGA